MTLPYHDPSQNYLFCAEFPPYQPLGRIHFGTPGAKIAFSNALSYFSIASDSEEIFQQKFLHFEEKCLGLCPIPPLEPVSASVAIRCVTRVRDLPVLFTLKYAFFQIFRQAA